MGESFEDLPIERLDHLLQTGTLVSRFLRDDFFVRYEFSAVGPNDYQLVVKGITDTVEASVHAEDIIRLVLRACFKDAEYVPDPEREKSYQERWLKSRERETDKVGAITKDKT